MSVPIGEIDVTISLSNQLAIMKALEHKKMSAQDWIGELVNQVYLLNEICLQQQQELDKLNNAPKLDARFRQVL